MGQFQNGDLMFKGIYTVLYALFDRDERIDDKAMKRQIDFCIEVGCQGITILGLATEVQKLAFTERAKLVELTAKHTNGRVPLSVTIPGNSVAEQVELIRIAEDQNASWIILQPPLAGSYGADIYLEFFERVASQTNLPFAVQNAPAFLGRALSATDIATLRRRCSNFAAVKSEDSVLGVSSVIKAAGSDLAVLGGRGGLEMMDLMEIGCNGFVYAPDIAPAAIKIFEAWEAGNKELANKLYSEALPAIVFSMQSLEHLVTYGKRVLGQAMGIEIFDRAPCLKPTEAGMKITANYAKSLINFKKEHDL